MKILIASVLALIGTSLAAELTHIVVCIKTATWGLLIAGCLLPPVGVVHGIGCWFGAW
jgi:hypothetical protein